MKKLISKIVLAMMMSGFLTHVSAQTDVTKAQAYFIYNFTKYIEWPNNANNGSFNISVFGSGSLYNELKEYLGNKMVGSRSINVQNISNPAEIGNCQILFVAFGKTREIKGLKSKLDNSNSLIIAERVGALEDGATINFIFLDDKLSYEIRPGNASKAGLKLNSTIINYAKSKT